MTVPAPKRRIRDGSTRSGGNAGSKIRGTCLLHCGAAPAEAGWREEANALLEEAKAIADGIAGPELAAHLKAAGAAPDAPGALAARIRAMLGGAPAEPAGDPRPVAPPGPR